MTPVVHTPADLSAALDRARAAGKTVGVVPTMGALHGGHLSLVAEARRHGATFVVVTIFVNPTQFNDPKDLAAYPRTLTEDLRMCTDAGVDLVFAPAAETMYPAGFETFVEVTGLTARYEGAHRPGHFRGVTTVVTKLLAMTAPAVAVFGRKDYQQWKVLERMVRDLNLRITMVAAPILREPDGLAMSSRNARLSADERRRALAIHRGLTAAAAAWARGERHAEALTAPVRAAILEANGVIDYVDAADPDTLAPQTGTVPRTILLVAARIGETRLLDNLALPVTSP